MLSRLIRRGQRMTALVVVLLLIELMDELVFGVREAALPLIRDAFALSYIQISLLFAIPAVIADMIEPFIGILGDTRYRKHLLLAGGIVFSLELLAVAVSNSFLMLLMAFILFYPASGAFVNLAQATLMDYEPDRHEQNMARWTLAGSIGVVAGPIVLSIALGFGIDWRGLFIGMSVMSMVLVWLSWRYVTPHLNMISEEDRPNFKQSLHNALQVLRQWRVMKWVVMLQFSDLMLDILLGYLALYFVDVVGLTAGEAAFAISIWTGVGLIGDFALVYLLEKVKGLTYLRLSVVLELFLYSAFLLVDNLPLKLAILGVIGFFNAGWYSILQGRLYSALPGQSGLVLTVNNIGGLFSSLFPVIIGAVANQWGLATAMWLILAGPIALIIGLPRHDTVDYAPVDED